MLNKFNYSINYDSSDRPVSYTLNNIDKKSSYSGSASYDSKDRVTSIQRGSMTFNYTYDCDGRIIREDNENQNYTLRFKYDKKGNVAKREELKYTDSGKPDEEIDFYEITELNYSDDDLWLESIEILCDEEELSLTVDTDVNGNTINYKMNNYNLLEYEWTNGRQLSAIYYADEETGESVCVARMTYDESGMRTSKTTEGVTTYYTYQGDKLLSQYQQDENGNIINVMIFLYDEEDNIVGVNYRGIFYYYVYDTQGNVISIYDEYGTSSMSYQYDAWGRIRTIYDSGCPLYNVNPITYRGYYYDNDLGLYYLQSRYYEPGFGRFINADDPRIALESKEETDGTNLFAYCCNDPVNNTDPSGFKSSGKKYTITVRFYMYFKYNKTNGKKIKVYPNPFGHIDLAFGGKVYTYGEYFMDKKKKKRDNTYANFVIARESEYINYMKKSREIRKTIKFKFNAAQYKRISDYYYNLRVNASYRGSSKSYTGFRKKINKGKYKNYSVTKANCATMVLDAFNYAVGIDKLKLKSLNKPRDVYDYIAYLKEINKM